MTQFTLEHPWMFFALVCFSLFTIIVISGNVCELVKMKMIKSSTEKMMDIENAKEQNNA